jgi:hypothetical protein
MAVAPDMNMVRSGVSVGFQANEAPENPVNDKASRAADNTCFFIFYSRNWLKKKEINLRPPNFQRQKHRFTSATNGLLKHQFGTHKADTSLFKLCPARE